MESPCLSYIVFGFGLLLCIIYMVLVTSLYIYIFFYWLSSSSQFDSFANNFLSCFFYDGTKEERLAVRDYQLKEDSEFEKKYAPTPRMVFRRESVV